MTHYFVHRYDVVRIKVAVEAESHAEAMAAADDYLAKHNVLPSRAISNHMGYDNDPDIALHHHYPTWLAVEPAEEVTGYLVDEVGDDEFDKSQSYDECGHIPPEPWADADNYPREDWRYDVINEHTQLGYAEWVSHKRMQEQDNG